jgi:hypothetical protein
VKIDWSQGVIAYPTGNLLVAWGAAVPRQAKELLQRLFEVLESRGEYCLRIRAENGQHVIDCVFGDDVDADRAARALLAIAIGRYPGWHRQWEVAFTANVEAAILAALEEFEALPIAASVTDSPMSVAAD